jgi:RimJ/RimL family protein N-acetyltransferase
VVGEADFIGYVGLAEVTFEASFTPAVEVGWRLARSAWGYGYASEAARAALVFGFNEAGLPEIVSFGPTGRCTPPARSLSTPADAKAGYLR